MEHFAIIVSVCSGLLCISNAVSLILLKYKGFKKIKEGQKCMLRNEILKIYYKYKKDAELPQYERQNLDYLYEAYEGLDGNSFVHDVYEDMREWGILANK